MKLQTKYDLGEVVFYMVGHKASCSPIDAIKVKADTENDFIQIRYRVIGDNHTPQKEQLGFLKITDSQPKRNYSNLYKSIK